MGNVRNITHNTFPKQGDDLGDLVDISLNERPVKATIVRSDIESPGCKLYRTENGLYVTELELEAGFTWPEQGTYLNRRANVFFHYDASNGMEGTIVRDDCEAPYITAIRLDDGRVVSTAECQYSPLEDAVVTEETPQPKTPELDGLKVYLQRRTKIERAADLHGIYKQLVPSRRGNTASGPFADLTLPPVITSFSIEEVAETIVKGIRLQEIAMYVAREMANYPHLQHHATRLSEYYAKGRAIAVTGFSTPVGPVN